MSLFGKVKNTIGLLKSVDLDALAKLSQKVDLSQVMSAVGNLDDRQLKGLMKMLNSQAKKGQHKLPPIDGDFYNLATKLSPEEREEMTIDGKIIVTCQFCNAEQHFDPAALSPPT